MKRYSMIAVSALSLAVMAGGCKKEETTTVTPAKTDPVVTPNDTTLSKGKSQAENVVGQLSGSAKSTGTAAQADAAKATDAAKSGAAAAVDAGKDALSKLDSVKELISAKKFDEADKMLQAIEAKKDSLPDSLKDQLVTVRKSLDTAKAALAVPGLGK